MKPRHAAALALVGWYLMMPPMTCRPSIQINTPLSHWEISSSYDTADECEKCGWLQAAGWLMLMAKRPATRPEVTPQFVSPATSLSAISFGANGHYDCAEPSVIEARAIEFHICVSRKASQHAQHHRLDHASRLADNSRGHASDQLTPAPGSRSTLNSSECCRSPERGAPP